MRKGFTLIEVLVVAVIVAILAAVAIPAYSGYITSSRSRVALNTAGVIAAAVAAYVSEFPGFDAEDIDDTSGGDQMEIGAGSGNTVTIPANYTASIDGNDVLVQSDEDTAASGRVRWAQ